MKTLAFLFIFLFVTSVVAQDQTTTFEKKEKSRGLAIGLGLDPIPGDGLIYTGHPVQGSIAMAIGLTGAVGIALAATSGCKEDCLGEAVVAGGGMILYATSYLWDAIGSIVASKKFKKKNAEIINPTTPASSTPPQTSYPYTDRDELLLQTH